MNDSSGNVLHRMIFRVSSTGPFIKSFGVMMRFLIGRMIDDLAQALSTRRYATGVLWVIYRGLTRIFHTPRVKYPPFGPPLARTAGQRAGLAQPFASRPNVDRLRRFFTILLHSSILGKARKGLPRVPREVHISQCLVKYAG